MFRPNRFKDLWTYIMKYLNMAKPLHINVNNKPGEFYVITTFFGILKKNLVWTRPVLVVPDAAPINIFEVDNNWKNVMGLQVKHPNLVKNKLQHIRKTDDEEVIQTNAINDQSNNINDNHSRKIRDSNPTRRSARGIQACYEIFGDP